jgi:flagellar protein FlaG
MSQINDVKALPVGGGSVLQINAPGSSSPARAANSDSGNGLPVQGQKETKAAMGSAVDKAVVQVNDYLQAQNRSLEFSVDKSTGQTIIKIVDQANGKVLRQIPPEYVVHLAQTLLEHNGVRSTGIELKT